MGGQREREMVVEQRGGRDCACHVATQWHVSIQTHGCRHAIARKCPNTPFKHTDVCADEMCGHLRVDVSCVCVVQCVKVHTWTALINTAAVHPPVVRETQKLFSTLAMRVAQDRLQKQPIQKPAAHNEFEYDWKAHTNKKSKIDNNMSVGKRIRMLGGHGRGKKFVNAENGEILHAIAVSKVRWQEGLPHTTQDAATLFNAYPPQKEWMWMFQRESARGEKLLVMAKGDALLCKGKRTGWVLLPPQPEDACIDFGETDMSHGAIVGFECPLGKERKRIPVRGAQCNHHQCFDRDNWLLHCRVRILRHAFVFHRAVVTDGCFNLNSTKHPM